MLILFNQGIHRLRPPCYHRMKEKTLRERGGERVLDVVGQGIGNVFRTLLEAYAEHLSVDGLDRGIRG